MESLANIMDLVLFTIVVPGILCSGAAVYMFQTVILKPMLHNELLLFLFISF